MAGVTVFVHQLDCEEGKEPKVGDILTFNYEPRPALAKEGSLSWLFLGLSLNCAF